MNELNKIKVESWKDGWSEGVKSVLQFLKEMKELDFEEEYYKWEKADEYTKLDGTIVRRYE